MHKNNGIMVFRWKEVKFSQNGIDQFFGPWPPDRHTIVRAKIQGKTAFFSKFWHVEFISAWKSELNPTLFEKNAKK